METDAVLIREAQGADAETLARFNEAMALETERLRLDPLTIRAGVRAVLADPARGRYFVAERDGRIAGALLVTYEWSDWRNARFLWLQSVYVEPRERRKGIFTSLFRHLEKLVSRGGHCGLRLYVDKDNAAAREVYRRLGLEHRHYLVLESPDLLRED